MRNRITILLAALLTFASIAEGQSIEYIGSTFWSGVNDVVVRGDYCYCAFLHGLVILDVSSPAEPIFVSQLFYQGEGNGIFISGDYAFLADGDSGLKIIDISDPEEPEHIGEYDTPAYCNNVFIVQNLAFVADLGYGLIIIDINIPYNPTYIGQYEDSGIRDVHVTGNYAFIVGNSGIKSINISNMENPVLEDSVIVYITHFGITAENNYAYVACGEVGDHGDRWGILKIFNIEDPSNIYIEGSYITPYGRFFDLLIYSEHAIIAGEGLYIVNVENPDSTYLVSSNYYSGGSGLDINNLKIFLANWHRSVKIIDISEISNLFQAGIYETPYETRDIYVKDDYAYIADHNTAIGLNVADITDPAHPFPAASLPLGTDFSADDIYISGDMAFLVTNCIHIVNISNPLAPSIINNIQLSSYPIDVAVENSHLYTFTPDRFHIIDVAIPSQPVFCGSCEIDDRGREIFVSGNYAYIASGESGLFILNISDFNQPEVIGHYDSPDMAFDVDVSDELAFIADDDGMRIINISDPNNPYEVGFYDTPLSWGSVDIKVIGNIAILLHRYGIFTIDVSNPSNPVLIDSYFLACNSGNLNIQDEYIYLANNISFIILRSDELTDLNILELAIPDNFSLSQNYPNPFNAQTQINYSLPYAGNVKIDIYDILGRKVRSLYNGSQTAGEHSIIWRANGFASGVYFYRLTAGDRKFAKQLTLIK